MTFRISCLFLLALTYAPRRFSTWLKRQECEAITFASLDEQCLLAVALFVVGIIAARLAAKRTYFPIVHTRGLPSSLGHLKYIFMSSVKMAVILIIRFHMNDAAVFFLFLSSAPCSSLLPESKLFFRMKGLFPQNFIFSPPTVLCRMYSQGVGGKIRLWSFNFELSLSKNLFSRKQSSNSGIGYG